jgi:hypothetical protein
MPCNPVTLCRDLRNFIVDALLMQLASRCTMAGILGPCGVRGLCESENQIIDMNLVSFHYSAFLNDLHDDTRGKCLANKSHI